MAPSASTYGCGSPLLSLPLELILQISRHLPTPDYGHLRLVCKHLETALHNSFSKEFFSKRQFMLTEFSLQALVDISRSRFSDTLQHVIISVDRPASQPQVTNTPWYQLHRLARELEDHITLIHSWQDVVMLTEAFNKLKRLSTVEIRDFDSMSRYRDCSIGTSSWKSYGSSTYLQATGVPVGLPISRVYGNGSYDHKLYTSRIFLGLLQALGASPLRPIRFEVNLRTSGIVDSAFNLPTYLEPSLLPVVANLRELYLEFNSRSVLDSDLDQSFPPTESGSLKKFLSQAIRLERLRLNFGNHCNLDLLEFLAGIPSLIPFLVLNTQHAVMDNSVSPSSTPDTLRCLRTLDIGKVTMTVDTLLAILENHKTTLRGINLYRIKFRSDVALPQNVVMWELFLDRLAKMGTGLTHISLDTLAQLGPNATSGFIHFKDRPEHETKNRTWGGSNVESGLKDFVANLELRKHR